MVIINNLCKSQRSRKLNDDTLVVTVMIFALDILLREKELT